MGNKIGKQQIQTTQTLNELIKQSNEQTACGPDCQTTCEKLYAQGGECEFTSAGDENGEKNFTRCIFNRRIKGLLRAHRDWSRLSLLLLVWKIHSNLEKV